MPDQLGSTRALTDASGAVVGGYGYTPWGVVTAHTGTAGTPLQFTGQYADAETGLLYLRARYYDPTTAQFLTVDPMLDMTASRYGYAGGNPLNATDPTGLCSWYNAYCQVVQPVAHGVSSVAGFVASTTEAEYRMVAEGTVGVCATGSIAAGPGGGASVCLTLSHLTHPGAVLTLSGGGGSPSAGVTLGVLYSNATDPAQLAGPFGYAGGSATVGPGVGPTIGATGFAGFDSCNNTIYGGTFDVGVGADIPIPFETHSGVSYTWVLWG